MWGRMEGCSGLLQTSNGRALFVSPQGKSLEPFPKLWAAGVDAIPALLLGRSKVLIQAAMLVPGPGPQSCHQPRGLVGPKTTCSNWSSTLLWGWKSGFFVSSSFFKRKSGSKHPHLLTNRAFGAVAVPILILNQSSPGEGLNTVCSLCWHTYRKPWTLQVGVTALCQHCPFFSSTLPQSGTRKVDLLIIYQKATD